MTLKEGVDRHEREIAALLEEAGAFVVMIGRLLNTEQRVASSLGELNRELESLMPWQALRIDK